jgi:beta-glucuronidase
MYDTWKNEFSPATVTVRPAGAGQLEVAVTARKNFPSYTLRNYKLKAGPQVFDIPILSLGETAKFTINTPATATARTVELEKPGGFVILKTSY